MDPYRKRQLTARGLLVLGILLAAVAEFLPWMIYHYSEFSRSGMPVGDIRIYLPQVLHQNAVELGRDTARLPSRPSTARRRRCPPRTARSSRARPSRSARRS